MSPLLPPSSFSADQDPRPVAQPELHFWIPPPWHLLFWCFLQLWDRGHKLLQEIPRDQAVPGNACGQLPFPSPSGLPNVWRYIRYFNTTDNVDCSCITTVELWPVAQPNGFRLSKLATLFLFVLAAIFLYFTV